MPMDYSATTVRHVTIQQLLKATRLHSSAPFRIDGKDLKLAVLLGNPHDISTGTTSVDFMLDDGTGRLRVKLWTECGQKMAKILESPYVRVVGELQVYRDLKSLRAKSVLAAPDPHQIFEHILKAVHETVVCIQGPPPLQSLEINEQQPPENDSEVGMDINHAQLFAPSFEPADHSTGSSAQPAVANLTLDDYLCAPIRSMHLGIAGPSAVPSPSILTNFRYLSNPYLGLSDLGKHIIQALKDLIHLAHMGSHANWDGIAIAAIFELVSIRNPEVAEIVFNSALDTLIEAGIIYRPIVNSHCLLNE